MREFMTTRSRASAGNEFDDLVLQVVVVCSSCLYRLGLQAWRYLLPIAILIAGFPGETSIAGRVWGAQMAADTRHIVYATVRVSSESVARTDHLTLGDIAV